MFRDEIQRAIESALPAQLAGLATDIWRAHAAGHLDDDAAQGLAEMIRAKQLAGREVAGPVQLGRLISIFPAKRRQASPDRAASIARRRTIAASGPLPPALAARFTTGQLAVLGVVGDELAARGECTLTVAEIAARAGVSHRLAQTAIRLAEGDGLVVILERRQKGDVNLPNVVRLLSREWKAWLARRGGRGCRFSRPTDSRVHKKDLVETVDSANLATGTAPGGTRQPGMGQAVLQDGRWRPFRCPDGPR